jgi:nucleoside-diphosphate-sugar epimerase
MKVLVTGATGFAGRALVAALRAEGHAVRALVRDGCAAGARARLLGLGAELVAGHLSDVLSLERAALGCEAVFHYARLDDVARPPADHEAINLVGTEHLLAACRAVGIRRLIYRSTTDVTLGDHDRCYVGEDFVQPVPFDEPSCVIRALAEDLVAAASDATFETIVLRAGWLWGVDDTCLAPRLVRAARREIPWRWIDGGRALCATTHVRNLTAASLCALVAPEGATGVFTITDDERVTVREFTDRLASALGVVVRGSSMPFPVARALAWIAERRGLHGRRAWVRAYGRSAHFNVQRARTVLAWAPVVDVAAGLHAVKAWALRVGVDAIARAEVPATPPMEQ